MIRHLTIGFVLAVFAIAACSEDHDHDHGHGTGSGGHTSPYPSCNEITQTCSAVDVGPGPIHDCHEQGHAATSDGPCAQIKANCLAICKAAAADGGGGGGGGGDGGRD